MTGYIDPIGNHVEFDGVNALSTADQLASPFSLTASAGPVGPEFPVNTTVVGHQLFPSVTALTGGGFVVTWHLDSGSLQEVYGQLFDASGRRIGSEFQINSTTANSQRWTSVTALPDDGFVVTWESWAFGPQYPTSGVFGQIYGPGGTKKGSEFRIADHEGYDTRVTNLGANGFVVTWTSYPTDGSSYGVYAQRYDQGGNKVGSKILVNTTTLNAQENQHVTASSDGGFVVAWDSEGQDGSGDGIFAQRFGLNGEKVGGEFQVNVTTSDHQVGPRIETLSNGGYIFAWTSKGQDGSGIGVYARLFSAIGVAIGGEIPVNTTVAGDQHVNSVVALNSGGFLIIWESDNQDGSGSGVFGQFFNVDGTKQGGEFQINSYTTGSQDAPTGAVLTNGDVVVTWHSEGQDGGGYGIFGQILRPVGNGSLFTESKDVVDFNNLTADQATAVSNGAQTGDALDGNDEIRMAPNTGSINGGAGNDWISGSAGKDVIYGGSGDDRMSGAMGDDTFHIDFGNDTISDLGGRDILIVSAGASLEATVAEAFTATVESRNSGTAKLTTNGSRIDLSAAVGTENGFTISNVGAGTIIIASVKGDTLVGGTGSDRIWGGLGSDAIDGGGGDDRLYAGVDALLFTDDNVSNTLEGGEGKDELLAWTSGGAQGISAVRDHLDGGSGVDTYYVDGNDLIANFEPGEVAYLWGGGSVDQVVVFADDSGTRVRVFSGLGTDTQTLVAQTTFGNRVHPRDIVLTFDPLGGNSLKISYEVDVGARLEELAQKISVEVSRLACLLGPAIDLVAGKVFGDIVERAAGKTMDGLRSKLAAAAAEDYSGEVAVAIEKSVQKFGEFSEKAMEKLVYDAIKKQAVGDLVECQGVATPEWVSWATIALGLVPGIGKGAAEFIEIGSAGIIMSFEWMMQEMDREFELILERAPDTRHFVRPKVGADLSPPTESTAQEGPAGRNTYLVSRSPEIENGAATAGQDVVYSGLTAFVLPAGVENGVLIHATTGPGIALEGNGQDNVLGGNSADNFLLGHGGNDELVGGAGNDVLAGGEGLDRLNGGDGKDRFTGTLQELHGDHVEDFEEGDAIVVEGQGFGPAAVSLSSGSTIISIDVDLDGMVDARIVLETDLSEYLAAGLRLSVAPSVTGDETVIAFVPVANPTASIGPGLLEVAEGSTGSSSFGYLVTLDRASTSTQIIHWSVSGEGEAEASAVDFEGGSWPSGILTFLPGETSKEIVVHVSGDAIVELDEGFEVVLSTPSAGLAIGTASADGKIVNDDASISILAQSETFDEGKAGLTPIVFSMTRTGDTSVAHTVTFAVSGSGSSPANSADFIGGVLPSGMVTFLAGETSKSLTVLVSGDTLVEPDEGFRVTLSAPSSGITLGVADASVVVRDDDAQLLPELIATDLAMSNTSLAPGNSFTVSYRVQNVGAAHAAASASRVYLSSDDTITASDTVLIFGGGASLLPGAVWEHNETTSLPSIAPGTYWIGAIADAGNSVAESDEGNNATTPVQITVLDDDGAVSVVALLAAKAEGTGSTTGFTFAVTTTGDASKTRSVAWAVTGTGASKADGADFAGGALPTGAITFQPGETSKALTITVNGDTTVEADEGFLVSLSNPSSSLKIGTGSTSGTIQNDDSLPVTVTAHDDAYIVLEGHSLTIAAATGVLFNDQNASNASLLANAGHGAAQLAGTGAFTYAPAVGFTGLDSFTYHAVPGGNGIDGKAVLYVVPVNTGASTTLDLLGLTAAEQIAATYTAFFGRAADAGGHDFWVGQFVQGLPTQGAAALFANIASSFGISAEAKALYPFLANPFSASDAQISAFLDSVYNNLFNRSSDAGGLAYWTGQLKQTLQAGQFVGSVLVNIMSGAQDTAAGKDITTLMGKVAVSLEFVREQEEHDTVWSGASDITAATSLLQPVTSDPLSVLVGVRNAEALIAAHV